MDAWFFERHCSDMSIICGRQTSQSKKSIFVWTYDFNLPRVCYNIILLIQKEFSKSVHLQQIWKKAKTYVIDRYRKSRQFWNQTFVLHPLFPYVIVTTQPKKNKRKTSFAMSFSLTVSWYMYYNYGHMFLSWSGYEIFGKCSTSLKVWQWHLVRGLGLSI